MTIDPGKWPRKLLESTDRDLSAFVGFRESTLQNGMRIIDAYSASGLNFTLLPDRGLDIWSASYKGLPLTWLSPGSPHPPDWGAGWLRQFNGGLLTTCGLSHVGPAEVDAVTGERRDIHGNYTRLRAQSVRPNTGNGWMTDEDDEPGDLPPLPYRLESALTADLYDSTLHGAQIKAERTYMISLQQADIGIVDYFTNQGDTPVPLMLLYHFNFGFPFIQEGSRLITPHAGVYARDDAAQAGIASWDRYNAPTPNYPEQVFYHHLKIAGEIKPDSGPLMSVLLATPDNEMAVVIRWDPRTLPYLTQWKNTRQGQYVCGIEPGNCIPEGQNAARSNGRLKMIEPGETVSTYVAIDVYDDPERIKLEIDYLLNWKEGIPHPDCKLDDYAAKYK